ncbi:MAG: sigma-54 dependent transcriptional regulator [Sphaerochaetaceae bacterium]|nr:sigma-54 dependent transcriptional regulator [Sphaerochaetaceae bacterium]
MKRTILIADDEKHIREGLSLALNDEDYNCLLAEDGEKAWQMVNDNDVDLVISVLRMPKLNGNELLKKIVSSYPNIPVVVLTGHGTVESAVEAMQNGAVDFITKPVNLNHLFLLIRRSLKQRDTEEINVKLTAELNEIKQESKYGKIIGKSKLIKNLMDKVAVVAPSKSSVLITGESGVGKELVADALHELSDRKGKPFIKVNCSALTETLLESELFGHEKGSFTGAISQKKGRFELADGGTIFLDEIGEINLTTQVKLLRVLQERSFERVGGQSTLKVDVRIIAATNRNLMEEIEKGTFREDLYYRLKVVSLDVPPLRERKEDINLLAIEFLHKFNKENNKNIEGFSPKAKKLLNKYNWPGNIRELKNNIEGAVVVCQKTVIDVEDLSIENTDQSQDNMISVPYGITMEEAEKIIIEENLMMNNGNKSKAASVLGIGRKTLSRKMETWGK